MNQPNAEQLAAVRAFAEKYGKDWKNKLSIAWSRGTDDREPNGALLRQLRNNFGPEWLKKFKL